MSASTIVVNLFCLVVLVIAIVTLVRGLRRKSDPARLSQAELSAMTDRTLWAYRRRLASLLALAAVLAPLGVAPAPLGLLLVHLVWPLSTFFLSDDLLAPWLFAGRAATVLTALGAGRALLAYAAACALADERDGASLAALIAALWRDRRQALLITVPMSAPTLLIALALLIVNASFWARFRSWLYPVFLIVGLPLILATALRLSSRWALIPALIRIEGLGLREALRRSGRLVRIHGSVVTNLLTDLWLIGWLMASVPAVGALALLRMAGALPASLPAWLIGLIGMLGSVFVAPLLALGPTMLYLHLRDRDDLATQIERFAQASAEAGK